MGFFELLFLICALVMVCVILAAIVLFGMYLVHYLRRDRDTDR